MLLDCLRDSVEISPSLPDLLLRDMLYPLLSVGDIKNGSDATVMEGV